MVAEAPHAVLPESLQFAQERFPEGGITAESLKGALDGALEVWSEDAE